MICERETEIKVIKYADKNHYTILANTFGALEYVKYEYDDVRTTKFLKWPKGSDSIIIKENNKKTKIKITELEK